MTTQLRQPARQPFNHEIALAEIKRLEDEARPLNKRLVALRQEYWNSTGAWPLMHRHN